MPKRSRSSSVPSSRKRARYSPVSRGGLKAAAETRFFTTEFDAVTVGSGGSLYDLTLIAQGDNYNQRDGVRAFIKSVHFSGILKCAASDKNNILRVMVGFATGTPEAAAPTSLYDTDLYRSSFVKYDKIFGSWVTDDTSGVTCTPINFKIKVNKEARYIGSGTAAPLYGQVWLGLVSDSGAVTHPSITGHAITYFKP